MSNGGTNYTIEGEVDGVPGIDFRIFVNSDHALTIADFIGVQSNPGGALPLDEMVAPPLAELTGADLPLVVQVIESHAISPNIPADVIYEPDMNRGEALSADLFINSAAAAPRMSPSPKPSRPPTRTRRQSSGTPSSRNSIWSRRSKSCEDQAALRSDPDWFVASSSTSQSWNSRTGRRPSAGRRQANQ